MSLHPANGIAYYEMKQRLRIHQTVQCSWGALTCLPMGQTSDGGWWEMQLRRIGVWSPANAPEVVALLKFSVCVYERISAQRQARACTTLTKARPYMDEKIAKTHTNHMAQLTRFTSADNSCS